VFDFLRRRSVAFFSPIDHRYEEYPVIREDGLMIMYRRGRDTRRVWKHGPAWTRGRKTLFLAVDGQPVTTWLTAGEEKHGRVDEFLREVWGEEVYESIPAEFRAKLAEFGATVTVKPVQVPESVDLTAVKANEILKESDMRSFGDAWGRALRNTLQEGMVQRIIYILVGAFGMYFIDHALEVF